MAQPTNHQLRDANHAARSEFAVVLGKFTRRLNDDAKAKNEIDVDNGSRKADADPWDRGTEIGRENARALVSQYLTHEGREMLGLDAGDLA